MADEEFMDAADDWELEAMRQEEEELERQAEEERLRKEKEERENKRRLAVETTAAAAAAAASSHSHADGAQLTEEAKQVLEIAQRELQDKQAAANLLGEKVESFLERDARSVDEARKLGADIAERFSMFDGDNLGAVSGPVFDLILKVFADSVELRELETALNVAKHNAKSVAKIDKKQSKTIVSHNALDLDTTDRGGAAEAQDDCGW